MSWVEAFFDDSLYDLQYAEVDENEERTARETEFLRAALGLGETSRVLDLACGRGRHALLLAPDVARIVGYDRTARFLDHARARAEQLGLSNAEFVLGDMRELAYEAEFDAAYNYFTAWGYYGDEENLDVLRRVRRALVPGGIFLLEMIHRDGLLRRYQARRWDELADGTVVLMENRLDHAAGRVHSRRIFVRPDGEREELEIDHQLPSADGLVRLFRTAGFADARAVSAPDGGELTLESFRVAAIGVR